jgi:hypothetical protein
MGAMTRKQRTFDPAWLSISGIAVQASGCGR